MSQFESFRKSKQKIRKTWERSEQNENTLNDVSLVTLNFNSINFKKQIAIIPIITNQLTTEVNDVQTILLENFPLWALNIIEPSLIYTIGDGFVSKIINISFSEANLNGTLKTGDISIENQDFKYWFNNVDQKHFLLKIFYSINIREATVSQFGFSSTSVPTFITLSLKLLNQRIYELMNEKKE